MYVYRIPNVKVCRQVVSGRLAQVEQTPDKTTEEEVVVVVGCATLSLSLTRSHTLNSHLSPLMSGACPAFCKPL